MKIAKIVLRLVSTGKKNRDRRALPFVVFEDGTSKELTSWDAVQFLVLLQKNKLIQ